MDNLLPQFRTVDTQGPPRNLAHLHWRVNRSKSMGAELINSLDTNILDKALPVLANGQRTHTKLQKRVPPNPLPVYGQAFGNPSPLSLEQRGVVQESPILENLPIIQKPIKITEVWFGMFNALQKNFELFSRSAGSTVSHVLLEPFSLRKKLVSGQMTEESNMIEESTRFDRGVVAATVSEESLDLPKLEERMYSVDFGPDALGIDLTWSPTHKSVIVQKVLEGGQAEQTELISVGDLVYGIGNVRLKSITEVSAIAKTRKADEPLQIIFLKAPQEPPQEEQDKTRIMGWWQNAMNREVAEELDFHDDDIPLEARMLLMEKPEPQEKESHMAMLLCKSMTDQSTITIQFTNQSDDFVMRVYWVDYFGIRRARNTLEPGTMYMERSYATHPWVVRIYKKGKADPDPQAHALMVRMGVDAANSCSTYTALWEPGQACLSFMSVAKTDIGRLHDTDNKEMAKTSQNIELKVRQKRAKFIQEIRDSRMDPSVLVSNSKAMPPGFGVPHLKVVVIDNKQRLNLPLTRRKPRRKKKNHGKS